MTIPEILTALVERGFSQSAIAKRVGASQPTINRALAGKDIRFSTGRAIQDFYISVSTGDEKHQRLNGINSPRTERLKTPSNSAVYASSEAGVEVRRVGHERDIAIDPP